MCYQLCHHAPSFSIISTSIRLVQALFSGVKITLFLLWNLHLQFEYIFYNLLYFSHFDGVKAKERQIHRYLCASIAKSMWVEEKRQEPPPLSPSNRGKGA